MEKTVSTIKSLLLKGAPVTCSVISAVAKGIVISNDRTMLVENGGYLSLTNDWAINILYKMERDGKRMVRRMANTAKVPVASGLLDEVKLDFQRKIKVVQSWHDISDELIINFDQTPLAFVCSPNHTLDIQGTKSIALILKGKKKQITGTFSISKAGHFLPLQHIYDGKTDRCLPRGIKFPDGFNVTYTPNHWSNEEKAIELLDVIIFPFLKKMREDLMLPDEQKALLIFDVFRGQKTSHVIDHIASNNCVVVYVPANLTNYFQPLDLASNANAKRFLEDKFETWYCKQITKGLKSGADVYAIDVNTNLSVMKPIHANWIIGFYDHMRNQEEIIKKNGWNIGCIRA